MITTTDLQRYSKHVLLNKDYCIIRSGTITEILDNAVQIKLARTDLYEYTLRWPGIEYTIGQNVIMVIPPDDYAVAIPEDKSYWHNNIPMEFLAITDKYYGNYD